MGGKLRSALQHLDIICQEHATNRAEDLRRLLKWRGKYGGQGLARKKEIRDNARRRGGGILRSLQAPETGISTYEYDPTRQYNIPIVYYSPEGLTTGRMAFDAARKLDRPSEQMPHLHSSGRFLARSKYPASNFSRSKARARRMFEEAKGISIGIDDDNDRGDTGAVTEERPRKSYLSKRSNRKE